MTEETMLQHAREAFAIMAKKAGRGKVKSLIEAIDANKVITGCYFTYQDADVACPRCPIAFMITGGENFDRGSSGIDLFSLVNEAIASFASSSVRGDFLYWYDISRQGLEQNRIARVREWAVEELSQLDHSDLDVNPLSLSGQAQ